MQGWQAPPGEGLEGQDKENGIFSAVNWKLLTLPKQGLGHNLLFTQNSLAKQL